MTELDNIQRNIQNHLVSTNVVLGDFLNSVNVLIVYSKKLEQDLDKANKELEELKNKNKDKKEKD